MSEKEAPFTRGIPKDNWSTPFNAFNSMKYLMWRKQIESILKGGFLPPYMVDIDVSNRCNFNCIWCNAEGIRKQSPTMLSKPHLFKLADFLKEWGVRSACFTGNTKVKLVDGTIKTFEELKTIWEKEKKPFEVYSRDKEGNIVPGIAINPRITRYVKKLLEITLDNGQIIKCTPDHKILLKTGEYKTAIELDKNDSLMPLHTHLSSGGYEIIKDDSYKGPTHWLFYKYWNKNQRKVIHHKNFIKTDNTKDNLEGMTNQEHSFLHANTLINIKRFERARDEWNQTKEHHEHVKKLGRTDTKRKKEWRESEECKAIARAAILDYNQSDEGRKRSGEIISEWNNSPEGRKSNLKKLKKINENKLWLESNSNPTCIEKRRKGKVKNVIKKVLHADLPITEENYNLFKRSGQANFDKIEKWFGSIEQAISYSTKNHKIISKRIIELINPVPVYCMTVKKFHNFCLSSGIFVKNCVAGGGEPLTNPAFDPFIDRMHKNGLKTGVITNGSLMTHRQGLAIMGSSWCGFSIDAGTSKTYSHIHNVKPEVFDKTINNLRDLVDMKRKHDSNVEITYKFLLHPLNASEILQSVLLAKDIGCDTFHLRPVCWDNLYNQSHSDSIDYSDYIDVINEQIGLAQTLEDGSFKFFGIRHKFNTDFTRKISFKRCLATPMMTTFGADGNVHLCFDCRGTPEWVLCRHIPNPSEILKVWGSEKHKKIIESIDPNKCPRCTFGSLNEIIEKVFIEDKMFKDFL